MHIPPRFQATGGIFEDFGDDRLQFTTTTTSTNSPAVGNNASGNYTNQQLAMANATIVSTTNPQQANKIVHTMGNQVGGGGVGGGYYPTAIHANYAIAPAPANAQGGANVGGAIKGRPQTLVVQRHVGQQKLFSVGGPSNC